MGGFNLHDHCIYYCGQESLKRSGVALTVNKTVLNVVLGCNLKKDRMISVHFHGKHFHYRHINALISNDAKQTTEHSHAALCSSEVKTLSRTRKHV